MDELSDEELKLLRVIDGSHTAGGWANPAISRLIEKGLLEARTKEITTTHITFVRTASGDAAVKRQNAR